MTPEPPTLLSTRCNASRRLPVNYRAEDHALFAQALTGDCPDAHLLELHDVSASAEGVLFRGRRILEPSFAAAHVRDALVKSPARMVRFLVKNSLFRRRVGREEPALWVTDDWSSGYFHWIADVLPRLYVARDVAREVPVLLPAIFATLRYATESLRHFDLKGVDFIAAAEVLRCRRLLLAERTAPSGEFHDAVIRELRTHILERVAAPVRPWRRIYISRAAASRRRIANEDAVLAVVREHGFDVARPEELSFDDQVRLFAETAVLVANHGAGMVNMMFMPAGAKVLELRRAGDGGSNCFFSLASAVGLSYSYQTCAGTTSGEDPHFGDVVVDPEELRRTLALVMR